MISKAHCQNYRNAVGHDRRFLFSAIRITIRRQNYGDSMANFLRAQSDHMVVLDEVNFNGSLYESKPYCKESIDILKEASSAAIFRARAALL